MCWLQSYKNVLPLHAYKNVSCIKRELRSALSPSHSVAGATERSPNLSLYGLWLLNVVGRKAKVNGNDTIVVGLRQAQ